MNNFIDYVEISNFKSIRQLKLTGFKKINLFIGRPNVGKSNLLEALSLFSLPYVYENTPRRLTEIVRLERHRELFYEGNIQTESFIAVGQYSSPKVRENCYVEFDRKTGGFRIDISLSRPHSNTFDINEKRVINGFYPDYSDSAKYKVDQSFKVTYDSSINNGKIIGDYIKRYVFNPNIKLKERITSFLFPPFGINLLYILESMPELLKLYVQWFRQYGLRLVLDIASQSVKIQKDKGDEVFQLPYSSIADTLQRIIFYKTAVASNENSVLLFEEPEAHAYPPYIAEFTQEVIKSQTNQFFIVTHSPIIVNDFLEGAIDDLAIFMVDFKDGQTVAKPLTEEEIREVRQYGVDLFFNNEAYLS